MAQNINHGNQRVIFMIIPLYQSFIVGRQNGKEREGGEREEHIFKIKKILKI